MKTLRIFTAAFFILSLFIFPSISCADDEIVEVPDVKVLADGKKITFDDAVISVNGRTLLPLRALLVNLGIQNDDEHIIWNSRDRSVTIIKDPIHVKLFVGSTTAYVDDVPVSLEASPVIYGKNEKSYIPAKFAAQSLGKIMDWDEHTKTVAISDPRVVTVSTADELTAAIDSDTTILLKNGVYNLSKTMQEYSERKTFWEGVYDGNQLVMDGIENLTIEGEGDTPAEIVVEPRYANVLNFRNSSNITVRNIKAGHTPEQGECAGGVFFFENSGDIRIFNCELYGCGIYGLALIDTNDLLFANSSVYNCNSSIMTVFSSKNLSFYNGRFYDNEGYDSAVIALDNSSLRFDGCDFFNNRVPNGYFFKMNLSKIDLKNSEIRNNTFRKLARDESGLTLDNTKTEGNSDTSDLADDNKNAYN